MGRGRGGGRCVMCVSVNLKEYFDFLLLNILFGCVLLVLSLTCSGLQGRF